MSVASDRTSILLDKMLSMISGDPSSRPQQLSSHFSTRSRRASVSPVPLPLVLPHLPLLLMSQPVNKFSTQTAPLVTLEDRMSSCQRKPSRKKHLTNTLLEDAPLALSSHKSQTERTPCLPLEDVFPTRTLLMLPHTSSPLLMLDGNKYYN